MVGNTSIQALADANSLINTVVEKCTFPASWTAVGQLSYQIVASQILTTVGPTLTGLLGSLSAAIGSIVFYFDDFDAIYTCVPGKTNSVVAPGLCG